ncbi:HNH endonuclease [Silanimonas sp.]|uniref:HNH endonuclease n=1 Tax=Silanimonas sp. TaxID=1929290 RepID=UPI0022C68A60|nr:HNH endonuclease [Silanimonas sp.]MCZ8113828.1 HNH endonuclease [Silanimonas sp.]
MSAENITADFVRSILDFDPHSGRLTWRENRGGIAAGSDAGTTHIKGYRVISVNKRLYKAHRLAWLHHYGEWPSRDIDHVNGNNADNRIANLRLATSKENQQNRRRANKNSQSGLLGASYDESRGLWQARIKVDGRQLYIGRFATAEEAHAAYLKAKAELHPFQTIAEAA